MAYPCVVEFRAGSESVYGSTNNLEKPPTITAAQLRNIIRKRALRRCFLNEALFADPAWDILLELHASNLEQRRHTIGTLCSVVNVPMTTSLRWLTTLQNEGLTTRSDDPLDCRRVFVSLSDAGRAAMEGYFQEIRPL